MTNAELKELERLAREATPGPWEFDAYGNIFVLVTDSIGEPTPSLIGEVANKNDAAFIAESRSAVLELTARLREAEDAMITSNEAVSAYFDKWFADRG
jgi:hypothetical protein